ncbi:hypothetical protein [Corynebacterium pseudopelargi]|uniref:hypothetical protein n=1 Tax=Corynebacterium pseudopelargi TaxID=2080757 RepID=UPI0019D4D173|nr:hypothetical protein [Corynebacterium pseudopelargi]
MTKKSSKTKQGNQCTRMAILDEDKQPHTPITLSTTNHNNRDNSTTTGTTNTTIIINSTKHIKSIGTLLSSQTTRTPTTVSATETQPNTATNTASTQHEQSSTPRVSHLRDINRVAATPIKLHTPQQTHKPAGKQRV